MVLPPDKIEVPERHEINVPRRGTRMLLLISRSNSRLRP
jgi:hypothetical protein